MKIKTVLFDNQDIFEHEIEEVLEYYYEGLIMWAVVRYPGKLIKFRIPLYALAIKNKPVFND